MAVEVRIDEATLRQWLAELPSSDNEAIGEEEKISGNMLLFSGNDYLGLTSHPAVRKAAAKAARNYGMGPRGSPLVCGQTDYHTLLEASLADLSKKEECVLCPTGFSANMSFISALGSISSLLALRRMPSDNDKIAIFSDALNHASIIDGIRVAERQQEMQLFIYRHRDMSHLDSILSHCPMEKKVVITDSLFSMDGVFAPMPELVALRKKHGFLLAHGTLVCGENGGGVAELFECQNEVDICIGSLSKAVGCLGGFIACSKIWKQLILPRGRMYVYSTVIPVPLAAAAYASLIVARKEKWRRSALWSRVREFNSLTQHNASSPIISLVLGSEAAAIRAARHMLRSGFHVIAIRPPQVPPNSCRLRVSLSASHSSADIERLVAALSSCIKFPLFGNNDRAVSKL
uniref:serine C-palmitoyltransferase n=1 Tax=Ananas comosus var. bracteatus TaxID=296719 RepID=A0A6V7PW08_ANACO|nr:unnamed protein product [Ananas comosus var. bracteatus]